MKYAQFVTAMAALCAMLAGATASQAQEKFPSHPITLIVPTAAGGGTDIATRFLVPELEKNLGQKILVVDKPGAGGAVGIQQMLQATPDGYTIAAVWNSPITITPQMFKTSYKMDNVVPIVISDIAPLVFCVKKDFPANDGKQFISVLKASPNKYTYGTDGVSGAVHFSGAEIFAALGVQARAIPYGGAGETLEAFLGNSVDIYGGSIPPIQPFVEKGTAKCLMVTTNKRSPVLPDAASVTDLGVPQTETVLWHGFVAPAQIPKDRLAILEKAFVAASLSPAYQAFAKKHGEEAVGWGTAQSQQKFQTEYTAFGHVIQTLGLANKTQ